MSMSKGYTLSSDLDLGHLLIAGYEKTRNNEDSKISTSAKLPKLKIAAIVNDAVATFVTTNYQMKTLLGKKVHMVSIAALEFYFRQSQLGYLQSCQLTISADSYHQVTWCVQTYWQFTCF